LEINTEASPFCIFYSTNKLFTLWICATKSKFLDISGLVSPTAHGHKLFSDATVTGGETMRVRYQRGYLRLGQRKKGPDRWKFLWWGAPRIHGELLMLGFDVSERTISGWMRRASRDPESAKRWLGDLLADALRGWNQNSPYTKADDWVFPSLKLKGKTPLSASIMAADKIRPAALKVGIRLEAGHRFGFHNFRHSLATFLVSRGKDVKTIQGLLRHAKASTTLDLYSQAIDTAKLAAQEEIAVAITGSAAAD
jgi:integrase